MQYSHIPYGPYEKYFKRPFDLICGILAIILFFWLFIIIAILVRVKLGSPVLFIQERPGRIDPKTGKEKIFKLYKFRTMTDEKDNDGNLLSDEIRLTKFGKLLRATSLDELPEVLNIIKGDMSFIGPRPQLVRDLVFMTSEQRIRHIMRPGLSGLAQVSGRNAISWDEKLKIDIRYVKNINFISDVEILFQTVNKAFFHQEGISQLDMATAEDFGDFLLRNNRVSKEEYIKKQLLAKEILSKGYIAYEWK